MPTGSPPGYTVIAPALFDRAERGIDIGYTAATIETGRDICAARMKLEDTLTDLQAAIDALKGAGKIGVVGYCWGGSLAFLAATRLSGIAAAVGYYGGTIAAHAKEKPRVPDHAAFRREGPRHPHERCREGQDGAAGRDDLHLHADHGFSCDERGSFDKPSHEKALERTLAFFKEHVG